MKISQKEIRKGFDAVIKYVQSQREFYKNTSGNYLRDFLMLTDISSSRYEEFYQELIRISEIFNRCDVDIIQKIRTASYLRQEIIMLRDKAKEMNLSTQVLTEYLSLLLEYEKQITEQVSILPKMQQCELIKIENEVINFIENPTFDLEVATFLAQIKENTLDSFNRYCQNKEKREIEIDEQDLSIQIKLHAVFGLHVLFQPVSKQLFNQAIAHLPHLVFCYFRYNREHLLMNEIVYRIIEGIIASASSEVQIKQLNLLVPILEESFRISDGKCERSRNLLNAIECLNMDFNGVEFSLNKNFSKEE